MELLYFTLKLIDIILLTSSDFRYFVIKVVSGQVALDRIYSYILYLPVYFAARLAVDKFRHYSIGISKIVAM